MNTETINIIIGGVFTIATAIITGVLIPFLKTKYTQEKRREWAKYVEIAVNAAEQMIEFKAEGMGKDKKAYVIDEVKKVFPKIPDDVLNNLIEASVKTINDTAKMLGEK